MSWFKRQLDGAYGNSELMSQTCNGVERSVDESIKSGGLYSYTQNTGLLPGIRQAGRKHISYPVEIFTILMVVQYGNHRQL